MASFTPYYPAEYLVSKQWPVQGQGLADQQVCGWTWTEVLGLAGSRGSLPWWPLPHAHRAQLCEHQLDRGEQAEDINNKNIITDS